MTKHKINDQITLYLCEGYQKQPIRNCSKWIQELNNPEAKQVQGTLCRLDVDTDEVIGECCLGVYCRVSQFPESAPVNKTTSKSEIRFRGYCNPGFEFQGNNKPRTSSIEVPVTDSSSGYIVGEGYVTQRNVVHLEHTSKEGHVTIYGPASTGNISFASINDNHWATFPEIAKIVDLLFTDLVE